MGDSSGSLEQRLLDLALSCVGTHALILLDPGGRVVAWLAGAERLLGYTAEEIVGKDVSLLFTPEDLEKDLSAWEQHTARGSGESEDDRWQVRKDGARIWASGTLTALYDQQHQLVGFAKVVRNRSDQKLQTEALESQIAALKQAEQRKNEFIATLAHELRSPLNAMRTAAEILKRSGAESEDRGFAVGIVERQVAFMGRMVDDLLEVARTAVRKVDLRKERVVVQEVIRQAIEVCQAKMDERTHELHALMPDVPIVLAGDGVRLRQVFINLLENAGKYTDYGGTIWVKATVEGKEAVVRVQDNGVGISPEVMPHIFDLFTQAEFASRAPGGLGIGLSVVKDIVSMHGGSVQATSDGLGKGSEFTVRLPLAEGV